MDGTNRKPARGRRSFTPQFKAETVDICRGGDRSIGQVARDYGLSESTLRGWVKQADIEAGLRSDGHTTAARKEQAELRRTKPRAREQRSRLVFGSVVVPIVIGCILLVIGTGWLVDTKRFLAEAVAGNGTVVDFVEETTYSTSSGDSDGTVFCPVVSVATPGGGTTQVEVDDCSAPRAFRVGQSVRILYDPQNPTKARLDTWFSIWGSIILFPIGLAFVAAGAGWYHLGRSDLRSARHLPRRDGPTSSRISDRDNPD
jgi:transposase